MRQFVRKFRARYEVNPFRKEDGSGFLKTRTHNRRRWSHIFPAGIFVGTIKDFRVEQGDHFYVIPFNFGVDFNSLEYVYVVKDISKKEVMNLENTVKDE